jgi:hypothetical protein
MFLRNFEKPFPVTALVKAQNGTRSGEHNTRAHPRDMHMKITAATNSSFIIKYYIYIYTYCGVIAKCGR